MIAVTQCCVPLCSDLSVWCFACDSYLDAQSILELRPLYEVAHLLKFGERPPFRSLEVLDLRRGQKGGSTPDRGGSTNCSTPCSSRTARCSSRTPPSSSRGRGSYTVCGAISPDPISFIDLESDEEGEEEEEEEDMVDMGMAWERVDYQATEQARHSAEQQQSSL